MKFFVPLLTLALLAKSVQAAVIDATTFIKQDGGHAGLTKAIASAQEGDTIVFSTRVSLSQRVFISKRITLDGQGNIIRDHASKYNLLYVTANGVTIKNIRFQQSITGGFRNAIGAAAEDVTVSNCMFHGSASGVGVYGLGEAPRGLTVENTVFTNMFTSIAYNRDVARIADPDPAKRAERALRGGVFTFKDNTFGGRSLIAITIDCGNDGSNGSETWPADDGRPLVTDKLTVFTSPDGSKRSLVQGNKMSKIGKFAVALATTSGFDVMNNSIQVGGMNSHIYRGCLHMEHNSAGNKVLNNHLGVLPGSLDRGAGAVLVTFSDYGNPVTYLQGVRDTVFNDNVFLGTGGRGFSGSGFKGITLERNDFTHLVENGGQDYSTYIVNSEPNEYTSAVNNKPRNPTV